MPTMNKSTRNNRRFDDDNNRNTAAGDNELFNNGLGNTDNGLLSAALNPPSGADDPPAAPTVFASIPTLADYLVSGYWAFSGYKGTGPRNFDHNNITVNITDLTAAEQTIAQLALNTWRDVANISVTYTSGAADITYINDGSGSAVTSYSSVSSGHIASSTVHISSDWSGGASTGNYSYFFQTYVHETGHALGLGHQGPYNNTGDYNTQALWTNDTWRWSVMSYFSQNNYNSDTYDYVLTPEMADIYAIQSIYGAQTTRTGNTTYGFNSNAGSFYNFSSYSGTPAFTIYDSGGTDTFDASGYSNNQTIDLTPGNWSSIGGETNNIGIYLTTTIENAYGGSGNDTIYGNDANNNLIGNGGADTLKGGGGADSLSGLAGDDSLNGGDGNDSLYGGDGNDSLKGAGGADYLSGGAGVDTATYDNSTTAIVANLSTGIGQGGDAAGDTYSSIENVLGTSGNDTLTGNSDANSLRGNEGNDTIRGFLGNDVLDGGDGTDVLSYDLDRAVTVSLATSAAQNTGGSGTDTVSNFENLTGSYFNDTLTGDGNANIINGNGGRDTINGLGGADTIYAGAPGNYYVEPQTRDNSTVATAISLDNRFVQNSSAIIQNSTSTPHATVVATGGGTFEYFKFTATAGAQAVFDIDQTVGIDTYLQLFGTDGTTVLATQDDGTIDAGSAPLPGGTAARDSYLTYTFATAGTYYIRVDSYPGGSGPAAGSQFTLHVSLGGAPLTNTTNGSILNGGGDADTIYGGAGNDLFVDDDFVSFDAYYAGGGIDTLDYSPVTFGSGLVTIDLSQQKTIVNGGNTETVSGFENVEGSQGGETIIGNSLGNVVNGNDGNDTIDGFLGDDTLTGGIGSDTLSYSLDLGVNVSLAITSAQNTGGSGSDTVSGFENLTGSYFNDTLTGNSAANVIRGGGGTDTLNGGAGNDTLYSGATNATIVKPQGQNNSSIGTAVNLDGHFGLQASDIIANPTTIPHATVTATASGNFEYYSFSMASGATATFDIDHTLGSVDTIIRLYGTDGSTQLISNDDSSIYDPGSDDLHDSSLTYTFATGGVYYLRVDSFPSTTPLAIGSTYTLNASISSAVAATVGGGSTLAGGTGDDAYYLVNTGDTVVEATSGGTDTVYAGFTYTLGSNVENLTLTGSGDVDGTGNDLVNTLLGTAGVNNLNGKGGADTMRGYDGDDRYYVDNANDEVIESASGGTDQVLAYVDYTLSNNVENISTNSASGTAAINLTGNSLANDIRGNAGDNILNGMGGADTMRGYDGDDRYYVDNANDEVIESTGGGTDQVVTYIDYTLSNNVENISTNFAAGTAAINLTGNSLANDIRGNNGDNILNGMGGADTMRGYDGDDKYYVDNTNDEVIESAGDGTDQVVAYVDYTLSNNVENIATNFAAGTAAIDLTGNGLANDIRGNAGDNILNGKGGADTMRGYGGDDTFVFDTTLGASNIDTVADFTAADDTIRLDRSVFGAITTLGTLLSSAFVVGAAAADSSDRIIYNSATGNLFYDSDGTGANAAVQFAHLNGNPGLSNTNFTVVA